jgi:hypothetical protein
MRAAGTLGTIRLSLMPVAGCVGPSPAGRIAAAETAMERRREANAAIAELGSRLTSARERAESAWTPPEERRHILEDERRLPAGRKGPDPVDRGVETGGDPAHPRGPWR